MSISPLSSTSIWQPKSGSSKTSPNSSAQFADLLRKNFADKVSGRTQGGAAPPTKSSDKLTLADGSVLDLAALREQQSADLKRLQQGIASLLAENGIGLEGGLSLQADEHGNVSVSGHSRQGEIESLIGAHPELEELVRSVSTQSRVLQTAKTSAITLSSESIDAALAGTPNSALIANIRISANHADVGFVAST